jgi:hypothetical protein
MTTHHWVAEKAIPFLKKDPNMGAMKLKRELEEKYQMTIGYSTIWLGRQKAAEHIFGTWEESFGYLYNFKAEVEQKNAWKYCRNRCSREGCWCIF